ncbi:MAG: tRNA pseudouridine(13) synthase TruD [Cycloclasticus sp.]|jgi:tRNA pseudouridine13 synthase|nr:tRNA pseudouridine(13) synthase TruD [Cycloclasticus sp.]HIL92536.1 tRNA pseudouridine(13) synthase TruD [Cycloclasticus sp.]
MNFESHVEKLPYAHAQPSGTGQLRTLAEHFCVEETLSFSPSGEGEHVFLYIKKIGINTEDIVRILSKHAGVTRRSVSYAGMKDRHAVTKQWFSVQLPGKEGPDWSALNNDQLNVELVTRHLKKLKRGTIKHNTFTLIVANARFDKQDITARVEGIKRDGVPNYFMQQRFGYAYQNLQRAFDCFEKGEVIRNKKLKGLFLSSVRSYLFNQVLAKRVAGSSWNKPTHGDTYMLNGTRQSFCENAVSDTLEQRVMEHDIHPTGPLFGSLAETGDKHPIEQTVFADNAVFCNGLTKERMEPARRSLRVVPIDFNCEFLDDGQLRLEFKLQSGSYATAVIRELINTSTTREQ